MDKQKLLEILNALLKNLNKLNSDMLILSKDKKRLKSIAHKIYKVTHNDGVLGFSSSKKFKPIKKIKSVKREDIESLLGFISAELKQCTSLHSQQQRDLKADLAFFLEPSRNYSSSLPSELLLNIFSFLDTHDRLAASLVCHSWNDTAKDNALWRDFLLEEKPAFDKEFINDLRLPNQSIFNLSSNLLTHNDECYILFKEGDINDPFGSVNANLEDFLETPHFASLEDLNSAAAFSSQGAQLFVVRLDVSDDQFAAWQSQKDLGSILQHVKSLDFNDAVFRNGEFQAINAKTPTR